MQRRTFIGGLAALFAVAAAPAPANILAHDKRVTHELEFISEEWLPYAGADERYRGCAMYRCLARCGDQYKYGACAFSAHVFYDPLVREHVREDAKKMLRSAFAQEAKGVTVSIAPIAA